MEIKVTERHIDRTNIKGRPITTTIPKLLVHSFGRATGKNIF